MKVENHGTMYHVGLDREAVLKIADTLTYTGQRNLAIQILVSTVFDLPSARKYTEDCLRDLASKTMQASVQQPNDEAPPTS